MTWIRRSAAVTMLALASACSLASAAAVSIPPPTLDAPRAAGQGPATAVVAGGCFWGIQAVFQHVRGVTAAVSGYAGGSKANAHYDLVGTGRTGHAESVEITYDPSQITYGQLLRVFFSVAHDPTELNRQGPDDGPQYRSAIFFANAEQQRIADAYIAQLDQAHAFGRRIATEVTPLTGFYAAEDYHQDYARLHPDDLYIMINDAPKVVNLRKQFPDMYIAK